VQWVAERFALAWGHDIHRDCPFSLTIALGFRKRHFMGPRYRFVFKVYWAWPQISWADDTWALNEEGYLPGMPIARRGIPSSLWTGRPWHIRSVAWVRGIEINRYA
jgi:hypothetical protein